MHKTKILAIVAILAAVALSGLYSQNSAVSAQAIKPHASDHTTGVPQTCTADVDGHEVEGRLFYSDVDNNNMHNHVGAPVEKDFCLPLGRSAGP